ncbi:MAG: 3-deoxy-manno-octulosonate cytidylyltransferase [Xanthomonadales bacterium]|nr:3-deoxy-manno-octulosonate cytidylyltransferase [Xanthomonadales bacterium]
MSYRIVIPARYASTRLPGKPLAMLAGKPMIEWVYQAGLKSAASEVVIATDDQRVLQVAEAFGAKVLMTSGQHVSGSDRIAECCNLLGWGDQQLVVNLQGDEPLMPPACLDQVASLLDQESTAGIASLYWPIADTAEFNDNHAVKVVCGEQQQALYFSRSPIPCGPVPNYRQANRHLGLYAYRNHELQALSQLQENALERQERLEQLRWLANGNQIRMAKAVEFIPPGVDSPEDLERADKALSEIQFKIQSKF